ncbi:MAG: ferredoxin [Candidatus Electrothrix sp. GW3-4]|uniref:ferredoxin n=1 Tax=Candidatus Electrothrix sp. GW3-4 TaxID=3126740 RepID=UPI0030CF3E85
MSEKVILDQEECIGCETCVEMCPSVFSFDDAEGKAYVNEDADADAGEECVEEAIASCPAECITTE